MARKVQLFDKSIVPACEYCEFGRNSSEYNMIICKKKGTVSPYFRCRSFKYNPIRRTPRRDDSYQSFSPEDFSL